MMVAIPSPHWSIFRSMNAQQLADVLQELAAHVNLRRYKKHPPDSIGFRGKITSC
jgi:hypothetical protein